MIASNIAGLKFPSRYRPPKIVTYFQPIVSIKQMKVVAVEALSRGVKEVGGSLIAPNRLFSHAEKAGSAPSLDSICSETALRSFKRLATNKWDLILFLNLHSSLILKGSNGTDSLVRLVDELGLNPSNIALEIPESAIGDEAALAEFLATFRRRGFLIALDDVGKGYSNLDRIPTIKPSLLKVDRSIVAGIADNFHKQQVFRSLVNLARTLGSLVVAEGVETEEAALAALECGADFLQGYYFEEPSVLDRDGMMSLGIEKIYSLAGKFIKRSTENFHRKRSEKQKFRLVMKDIRRQLEPLPLEKLNAKLHDIVPIYSIVECAYVIDASGIQVTDTVFNRPMFLKAPNPIFYPTPIGSNHSLKPYYYVLREVGLDYFQSDPYVSLASGNLCVTVSTPFRGGDGRSYILCVDFSA